MKHIPFAISITLLLCFYANAQSAVDLGTTTKDGEYINAGFGFSFKYPKDWVVHGQATTERIREIGKEKAAASGAASKEALDVAMKSTYQLLTVFRYPLGKPGITFNPAILIMAESVAHAPGITNGSDYLLNVRPVLLKSGYQALFNEPKECQFGGSQFFRDSYAVDVNGMHLVQAYFANVVKGYALVFVFTGQDEKSVDEMAKSMETFTPIVVRRGVTTTTPGRAPHRRPN